MGGHPWIRQCVTIVLHQVHSYSKLFSKGLTGWHPCALGIQFLLNCVMPQEAQGLWAEQFLKLFTFQMKIEKKNSKEFCIFVFQKTPLLALQ